MRELRGLLEELGRAQCLLSACVKHTWKPRINITFVPISIMKPNTARISHALEVLLKAVVMQ